jgi:1-acyl-sn-glycerol-3-phosphate acyltransferase
MEPKLDPRISLRRPHGPPPGVPLPPRRFARGTTPAPVALEPASSLSLPAAAPAPSDGMWHERWTTRWARRAVTIPGLFVATALVLAALPLLLLHAVVSDVVRRRPLLLCRFHMTIASTFVWHCIGVIAVSAWWVIGRARGMKGARWIAWHGLLEGWWAGKLVGIARLWYRMKVEVEDADEVAPGPTLILMRHASIVDTMLPSAVLGKPGLRMQMRIVKKRELLWDPCVDLVSSRVPRAFVRRGSGAPERELDAIRHLAGGMGAADAIVIFAEGTRFSPEKQAEVLARLRVKAPEAAERAARLRHVLPARPAGTLALLEHCPDMDVVVCAHTGLEGASRLGDFARGTLLDRTLKMKFWRIPRRAIPDTREGRLEWLEHVWRAVDCWVDTHRAKK